MHHCTSQPYRFFGRTAELALLDDALAGGPASLIALVGPGGQGKTAIVQHWLGSFVHGQRQAEGVFLWSFYRGKDVDLCLRQLYAYAAGQAELGDVSATWCVDQLLPVLRRERWALVLDGTEVVQYDNGPWMGRFVHPELGRLLEELSSSPLPGVVLLTTRFALPELEHRKHARVLTLGALDPLSARRLFLSLGAQGSDADLDEAATACGGHAKAVELLATCLQRFHGGDVTRHRALPMPDWASGFVGEEQHIARVLGAFQTALPAETQDILALTTAFREPPTEPQVLAYLRGSPVRALLHDIWGRIYDSFQERPDDWLAGQIQELVELRLLERVSAALHRAEVLDAHPLVRRGFEHVLGGAGRRQAARVRAGFLHGRPDRKKPEDLEQAREEIELFHAYADAGLWNEADGVYIALDNPKHRFLAPALERDLLGRFFPGGDWRQLPLWSGFGRHRGLAICLELLGQFGDALEAYRDVDAPLRGDALLALGRLGPLLDREHVPHPWQALWQAYRAHALCLAGRTTEAVALARSLVPVDAYEWLHAFECLLRAGSLAALDMRSFLYRPPQTAAHRWSDLARQRMQADYCRVTSDPDGQGLGKVYGELLEAYDRAGLPYERCLTRLGLARWLLASGQPEAAQAVNAVTLDLARRYGMRIVEADAWHLEADAAGRTGAETAQRARGTAERLRQEVGYRGPGRP